MLVKHERSCWTKDGNQLKILQIAGHKAAAEPVGELGGGAGDADGGKFRARGDHLRVVRALRPLDALQNVLGAVLERAVGRGLILEEDGHAAVVDVQRPKFVVGLRHFQRHLSPRCFLSFK